MSTATQNAVPRFALGRLVITPGAIDALQAAGEGALKFIDSHAAGDWGDLDAHDARMNQRALVTGARLMSEYKTKLGQKIWIITEAVGDDGQRSHTTTLLPSEY